MLNISIELHGCSSAQQAGPQGKCGGLTQCQTDSECTKTAHFIFISSHTITVKCLLKQLCEEFYVFFSGLLCSFLLKFWIIVYCFLFIEVILYRVSFFILIVWE